MLFLSETSALKVAVKADCLDAGEQTIKAASLTLTLTPITLTHIAVLIVFQFVPLFHFFFYLHILNL